MVPLIAGAMGLNALSGFTNTYLQYKNLEYQKDVQNKIFNREDDSIRRRVADLKAAGMSPVLAAGQGASAGNVVKTEAPQFDNSHMLNALSTMQMLNYQKQMEATDADISKTHAEENYINQQNRKTSLEGDQQFMNNEYQRKTGIPSSASPIAKGLRDIVGTATGPVGDAVKGLGNEIKRNINRSPQEAQKQPKLWDRWFGDTKK